jgi:type IV pilus assembly protein PilM
VNGEVASEIARTVDYFKTSAPDVGLDRVLVCGGVARVKGLVQQLGDHMHTPVEVANPFGEIDTTGSSIDQDELAAMAPLASVAVGLALRFVGDR